MAMSPLKKQELKLQAEMLDGLHGQNWFATKTSDRFKAGRPDLRIARRGFGQIDVELKYSLDDFSEETPTGLTKLQWLKITEMNEQDMPAVGLVYSAPLDLFFVTLLLRDTLSQHDRRVIRKLPRPQVIDGKELFEVATEYLTASGYTPR